MKKRDLFIVVVMIVGLLIFAFFARSADAQSLDAIEQIKNAGSIEKVMDIVGKVLTYAGYTCISFIVTGVLIAFIYNTIRRLTGRWAFSRAGLSIKSVARQATANGSVLVKINRKAFDGFWATVLDNGRIEEEIFYPWIGFETRQINVIRNQDYKNGKSEAAG